MRSELHTDNGMADALEMPKACRKSKSLQVGDHSEIPIASDFFLVKVRNQLLKFGTFGSFSNLTLRNERKKDSHFPFDVIHC